MKKLFAIVTVVVIIWSCSPKPYAATNKLYKKQVKAYAKLLMQYPLKDSAGLHFVTDWAGTTNFSMRRPNYVVLHHTAQNSCEQTVKTFTTTSTQVSAHYVICRDGSIHHMLNDLLRAHHAGVSKWGNVTDLNSSSIGIEIDNNGFEVFSEAQINSLIDLLARLKKAYNIPAANFIGHADVAPGRKVDPSRFFPWKQLAERGFGLWYDTARTQIPADFNAVQSLRVIGYNIADSVTAIQSFKIHFNPADTLKSITPADKKIIADLVKKYQ